METTTAVTKKKSIKDFYDCGYEMRNPKLSLKIKYLLEKVGVGKFIKNTYQDDVAYNDLTILLSPSYSSSGQYITKNFIDTTPKKEFIEKLNGYIGYSAYFEFKENKIPINVKIPPRTNIEIGCYIKEQNLIIIYFNFFEYSNLRIKDNEFINFFIEGVANFIRKNKIVKQDVKDFNKVKVMKSFSINVKIKLEDTKSKIENRKRGIKDYENGIIEYYKINAIDEKLVKNLEVLKDNAEDFLFKQIAEIKTLSFVEDVDFTASEGLKVKVTDVKINYNNKEIPMGDYFLYILPTNIKVCAVKPKKVGRYYYHHPHIDDNGKDCCFGTRRREEIYKLLGNNELKKVVYMLYLFLKSYTPNDKYHNIDYWLNKYDEVKDNDDEDDED